MSLFGEVAPATRQRSHLETVALRKGGAKPHEECFSFRALGKPGATNGDVLVKFSPCRLLTRGPRKGQRTWHGEATEVVVTDAEWREEERRYENETTRCHVCFGEGREVAGVHRDQGPRYRECRRCLGSGSAPKAGGGS